MGRISRFGSLLLALGLALPGVAAELLVGAAASLRAPLEAGLPAFEAERPGLRVRVSYGASSALAAQIRAGAPLDVLLSADIRIARSLAAAGLASEPREFARNRLVVVAAPGLTLRSADALLGLKRIAVPEHAVPVGRYAREWLKQRGLLAPLGDRLFPTEHARATLIAVDQGSVEAAIVYATDARLARRAELAFEIPDAEQPEILYAACVIRRAEDPALARAFIEHWRSGPGRAQLMQAGFLSGRP